MILVKPVPYYRVIPEEYMAPLVLDVEESGHHPHNEEYKYSDHHHKTTVYTRHPAQSGPSLVTGVSTTPCHCHYGASSQVSHDWGISHSLYGNILGKDSHSSGNNHIQHSVIFGTEKRLILLPTSCGLTIISIYELFLS